MTQSNLDNDALLQIGRIGTIALRGLLWLVGIVLIIAIPYLIVADASDLAELQLQISGAGISTDAKLVIALIGVIAMAILVLLERFLQQLQLLIESVGQGDPFAPVNSDRLARMGWLLLASQVMAFVGMAIAAYHSISDEADFTGDFSIEGLFIVVLLFILARVFKHGAAMREDLEGTV